MKDSSNDNSNDNVPVSFSVVSDTKIIPADVSTVAQEEEKRTKETVQQTEEGTLSPTTNTDTSTATANTAANKSYSKYPAPDYDAAKF